MTCRFESLKEEKCVFLTWSVSRWDAHIALIHSLGVLCEALVDEAIAVRVDVEIAEGEGHLPSASPCTLLGHVLQRDTAWLRKLHEQPDLVLTSGTQRLSVRNVETGCVIASEDAALVRADGVLLRPRDVNRVAHSYWWCVSGC